MTPTIAADPQTETEPAAQEPQTAHESRAGHVGQATTLPQEPDASGDGHSEPPRPPQPPTQGRGGRGGRKHRLPDWAVVLIFAGGIVLWGFICIRLINKLEHPEG